MPVGVGHRRAIRPLPSAVNGRLVKANGEIGPEALLGALPESRARVV